MPDGGHSVKDNPWTDAHWACEMTLREREASMKQDDWLPVLHKVLAQIGAGWEAAWISSGRCR